MYIKKRTISDSSVYRLSEIIGVGIDNAILSSVLGRVFVVNDNNVYLGAFSVDHCGETNNVNAISRIPCIYSDEDKTIEQQVMDILAMDNGKYFGCLPLVEKNNKLVGTVSFFDNMWDKDKLMCLSKLEYYREKNISLGSWFSDNKFYNVVFWGLNEMSLAFANEIKDCPSISVLGIFENEKQKEHIKIDYLNYDTDVNFVKSMNDVLDVNANLIVVCDWTMRHISENPIIKKSKTEVMYAVEILNSDSFSRHLTHTLIEEFKMSMKEKGCQFLTVRVPTEDDLKVPKKMTQMNLNERLKWLSKEEGWEPDSKEMREFNNARKTLRENIQKKNGRTYFGDCTSEHYNFIYRQRVVLNSPNNYDNIIYLIGPCIITSMFNSDKHSFGYYLQEKINERELNYKVAPIGMPNDADRFYYFRLLEDYDIKPGDIILHIEQTFRFTDWDLDLLPVFNDLYQKYGAEFYYDLPIHCGKDANKAIAEFLCDYIEQHRENNFDCTLQKFTLSPCVKEASFSGNPQLKKYQEFIQSSAIHKMPKIGSIVMNCNPFTLGHQYLIGYAAERVDYLYVFVVEEDKSYFKFEDRIELVKAGTAHLRNVKVLPSGQFIISSTTFSEYFDKANLKGTTIDTSLDVETFGSQIAPCLNISVRFVGEEPLDPITAQYNQSMKDILPKYGIEVCEIPRKEDEVGVISASRVRKCLEENKWDEIKKLVPETTYLFLEEKFK